MTEKRQVSLMYFCIARNMQQITSQLSVSFQNDNKSIFTGIPIKFNFFVSNNIIIKQNQVFTTKILKYVCYV